MNLRLFTVRNLARLAAACAALLISFSTSSGSSVTRFAPHYSRVRPGVYYSHLVLTNQPWSIHVVRVDLPQRDLEIISTHAQNHIASLGTVASQAASVPARLGQAIAAVNGDFFVLRAGPYQGDPDGLQILNGEIVSTPRLVSLWFDHGRPRMDEVKSRFQLSWPNGDRSPLGLNETPGSNSIVLFTPSFGASTRATNFFELTLEPAAGPGRQALRPNHDYTGRVHALNPTGNTTLGSNQVVLAFGSNLTNRIRDISIGAALKFSTELSKNLEAVDFAIGGGPRLIHRNHENTWPDSGKVKGAPNLRNPRTAVGYNSRHIFLVEVDGRQKELSVGMSFQELADLMKALGCTEAMNLDGGGSSTLWLEGKVMNSPSDKHERAVANALVLIEKSRH